MKQKVVKRKITKHKPNKIILKNTNDSNLITALLKQIKENKNHHEKQIEELKKENEYLKKLIPIELLPQPPSDLLKPIPKPRKPRTGPVPKPRTIKLIKVTKKPIPVGSYKKDKDGDLVTYDLDEMFNPIEVHKYTNWTNLHQIFNVIEEKIKEGYVYEMSAGETLHKDRGSIWTFDPAGFANLKAFQKFREKFNTETTKEEDIYYRGVVRFVKDSFSRIMRSQYGKGADYKF